ncbi:MarR family winged helix-turn-helix transcriptional regulator [Jiella sp. M17.18]|uniref:MarR family winged helix-turn-helix transcriptional regulator n=1 Tax=Jiella sp. M17.18 TaxID=3234247 RepID=UPI0034DF5E5B
MTEMSARPGHLARRFQQIAVAIFHREVAAAGSDLTPVQFAALETVAAQPGLDQATLAGLIAYDRATITGVVDRLVNRGLVTRETSARDRRAKLLAVTPAGEELLARIEPSVAAAQEIMLRGLTPEESADFMRLLRKAVDGANDLSRAPLR